MKFIGELKGLKKLNIVQEIEEFPMGILSLDHLEELEIHSQKLSSIPEKIWTLKNLKVLVIHVRRLSQFPLLRFNHDLSELGLGCEFPIEINFLNFKCIKRLHLSNYALSDTDSGFTNGAVFQNLKNIESLINLESLSLRDSSLKNFPLGIFKFEKLKAIFITASEIQKVPDDFLELKSLESVLFFSCAIQELPDQMGNLKNLKHIQIVKNRAKFKVPISIMELPNIEMIEMEEKSVSKEDQKMLKEAFSNASVYFTTQPRVANY